jgi:hypothetical protein
MERHRLEEVMASPDQALWVTLGFSSALESNDVLHIVSSANADEGLYLERFDQGYSAIGGAESVVVLPTAVEVHLTESARGELAFESADLVFDGAEDVPGYDRAIDVFRAMARAGYPIRVAIETTQ